LVRFSRLGGTQLGRILANLLLVSSPNGDASELFFAATTFDLVTSLTHLDSHTVWSSN